MPTILRPCRIDPGRAANQNCLMPFLIAPIPQQLPQNFPPAFASGLDEPVQHGNLIAVQLEPDFGLVDCGHLRAGPQMGGAPNRHRLRVPQHATEKWCHETEKRVENRNLWPDSDVRQGWQRIRRPGPCSVIPAAVQRRDMDALERRDDAVHVRSDPCESARRWVVRTSDSRGADSSSAGRLTSPTISNLNRRAIWAAGTPNSPGITLVTAIVGCSPTSHLMVNPKTFLVSTPSARNIGTPKSWAALDISHPLPLRGQWVAKDACVLHAPPQSGLHSIRNARWQLFRPLAHGSNRYPNCQRNGSWRPAQQFNGFCLLHSVD